MQFVVMVKCNQRVGNPYVFAHSMFALENVELVVRVDGPYDMIVVMNAECSEDVQDFFDGFRGIDEASIANVLYDPSKHLSSVHQVTNFTGNVSGRPKLKAATSPISQVPGVPAGNRARVYRDFSSQAGLASFGIGGLGHLGNLGE